MLPLHVREKIVALLTPGEKIQIDVFLLESSSELMEAQEVILYALGGILGRCGVADEKRPVARLSEKQLARELAEEAVLDRPGLLRVRSSQRGHPVLSSVQLRVNPAAFLVQPDIEKSAVAPTGARWLHDLQCRTMSQKIGRRDDR